MNLLLVLTAVAAVVSCGYRALGPRPTAWNEVPEGDVGAFQASFGFDPE